MSQNDDISSFENYLFRQMIPFIFSFEYGSYES